MAKTDNKNKLLINDQIKAKELRVVLEDGETFGIMSRNEALQKADELELDLVLISPNTNPPVCKIIDYGKYRYLEQKKAHDAKKKQHHTHLKELKIRPSIEPNDLQVKINKAYKFLKVGDKVKFSMQFRGRELYKLDSASEIMHQIQEACQDVSHSESPPHMEGRQMIMILVPSINKPTTKSNDQK